MMLTALTYIVVKVVKNVYAFSPHDGMMLMNNEDDDVLGLKLMMQYINARCRLYLNMFMLQLPLPEKTVEKLKQNQLMKKRNLASHEQRECC